MRPSPIALAPEHGAIGLDIALALQPDDASQARRGRQPDAIGKIGVAQPSVFLERGDDPAVDVVEAGFGMIPLIFGRN